MASFTDGTTLGALRVLNDQADQAVVKLRNLDNLIDDVSNRTASAPASISSSNGGGGGGGGAGSASSFRTPTYSARDRFLIDRFLQTVENANSVSLQGGFAVPSVTAGTPASIRAGSS